MKKWMEILSDMEMLHTDQNGRRLTPNSAVNGINDTPKAMEALHGSLTTAKTHLNTKDK